MNCPDALRQARLDRFHEGRFQILQPPRSGFRAGLDALLLAASVPEGATGLAADLGAGTGAVGFAAAARAPGLSVVLAEIDPGLCTLLRQSVALPGNEKLGSRLSVVQNDLLSTRTLREAAGLAEASFDLVLTNPPFYPSAGRASPDVLRHTALTVPDPEFLTRWMRVAASLLNRRGRLAAILRPADLPQVAAALAGRLGAITIRPVHTRPGAATRILLGAVQGSRAGLSILPGLVLFEGAEPANAISRAIAAGEHGVDLFA